MKKYKKIISMLIYIAWRHKVRFRDLFCKMATKHRFTEQNSCSCTWSVTNLFVIYLTMLLASQKLSRRMIVW
jgi:hypothetical protein